MAVSSGESGEDAGSAAAPDEDAEEDHQGVEREEITGEQGSAEDGEGEGVGGEDEGDGGEGRA